MSEQPEDPGGGRATSVFDEQDVPVDLVHLRDVATRARAALKVPRDADLTVTLVDEIRMAELKERAFGERAPTDVLAFPIDDLAAPSPGPLVLGDIVLCPAVAGRQARNRDHHLQEELDLLLIHGLLHLLGRDHADAAEERAMFAEQAEIVTLATAKGTR